MKLQQYLSDNGLTETGFAAKIGVSQVAINRYCTGRRMPKPDVMQKIVEATGGAVTPNDFFNVEAA